MIEIRAITSPHEASKVEQIQRRTWGIPERELIPARLLHALQFNGACLLGAYDGRDLVGFVFGVLGTVEDLKDRIDQVAAARLQMYSVTMGVLPEYQQAGTGFRLKTAQREFAIRIGVRLITWTYDPLESRNGYFNIRKLGAISHRYLEDFHGQMSGINVGLPTDRLYVEWWVTSNRVQTRMVASREPLSMGAYTSGGAPIVNAASITTEATPKYPGSFIRPEDRLIMVEIPGQFQAIKDGNMDLALGWRMHIREVLSYFFQGGYLITDFVRHTDEDGQARSYYVLTKMVDHRDGD